MRREEREERIIRKYSTVDEALKHFPSSVVLVGRRFGEDYHHIISQQRILGITPQAYYHPANEKYSVGLVVPKCELQGIADRYYNHNNVYINNTLTIYDASTKTKRR